MRKIGELERRTKDATSLEELGETLQELLSGPYEVWPNGELIEIKVFVDAVNDMRVEIRPKEEGHNIPHFHVVGQDFDASFEIETGRHMKGSINSRHLRLIRDWWARQARGGLLAIWNATRAS